MIFGRTAKSATDAEKRRAIDAMYAKAQAAVPEVPEITAEEVMRRRAAGEPVVLVDVRTPEERATSTIPGAITTDELEADPGRAEGVPVVAYCTVGGRSGQYARALRRHGIDAYNMPGAILAWTHAGGELVDADGRPTKQVNTHGAKYALAADGYESVW